MLQTAGYGGFQPVQSYIKLHAADCIHVFPQYPWDRGWRAVVRLPTRDSGPRNTIVALFEGRSFRTCGVELATASFHYETAMKELTSWIHATQDWLLVVAPVLLSQFLALFFSSLFSCLLVFSNASNLFSFAFSQVLFPPSHLFSRGFLLLLFDHFSSRGQEIAKRAATNSIHQILCRKWRILVLETS